MFLSVAAAWSSAQVKHQAPPMLGTKLGVELRLCYSVRSDAVRGDMQLRNMRKALLFGLRALLIVQVRRDGLCQLPQTL